MEVPGRLRVVAVDGLEPPLVGCTHDPDAPDALLFLPLANTAGASFAAACERIPQAGTFVPGGRIFIVFDRRSGILRKLFARRIATLHKASVTSALHARGFRDISYGSRAGYDLVVGTA